jgi:hypothetical protein
MNECLGIDKGRKPDTNVLDPAQNTIKRCRIKKMAVMNECLGIDKGRKWLR